ncbi:hypothetical protein FVR03_17070 [Pontibacter qinzhouensis]|uniref:PKD domain-containing protein n=1 Tax=Pontibacter qinzhouensis TaxID=2603253 RepID=A0A5C8JH08_9BACT|nr:hypothetical protein [Pontibacter qinzhouensis]TXK36692.1 hypothetical protein FVR03_17070 [Pontibacter qinzhouensis]
MKRIKILLYALLAPLFLITACQDDNYELGRMLDKSEIKFRIEQPLNLDAGGNTVILINETPGTLSMWDYGTGRSERRVDTVRFAFEGEYIIKFSAATAGGIVEMDPVTIQVTQNNLAYVDDPLWTALSGGVGNEKTWILDIDAKYFDGPLYFYGTDNGWEGACMNEGGDCWNWNPDYAGNTWLMPAGDYGTMTFNLKGGPFVTVNHKMLPNRGTENGTYFLDTDTRTLIMTDATPLHDAGRDGCVSSWGNIRLLSLTENAMQFAVLRMNSCEGAALLVYNYVSKEYSDNWVPEEPVDAGPDEGYNPTFAPGQLLNMLTGGASSGRVWNLDASGNPVDWIAGGKGWTESAASSSDWGWNTSWETAVADSWIRFDRFGGTQNYTRRQKGATTTGTFTIKEDTNEITLSNGNTLLQNPDSWMNPTASTIKVVKAFPNDFQSKGIWFGTSYDAGKDEWLAFHYIIP